MNKFEEYLQHTLDDIYDSDVKEAMKYSLLAPGKRIRPRLLLATLKAYGIEESVGYRCASAIEMIHAYSLIHDDLPAMDDDTLRRGLPTCHVKFGEACAILAGDALLTQAFTLGATASDDPTINAKICYALSTFAGADGMVLGQIKDLVGEQKEDLTVDELKDIHYYKTGKLLTLPLVCACYLANREEDLNSWTTIGHEIGLSFQIQDDILDVTSTVEELGKNINSDAQNNKKTYVSLLGIEKAQEEALRYYDDAHTILHQLDVDPSALDAIFQSLVNRKN